VKKIASWLFATVGGLVLLFSYRTSTEAVGPTALPEAGGTAAQGQTPVAPSTAPADDGDNDGGGDDRDDDGDGGGGGGGGGTSPAAGLKDGTYTGSRVDTRYGPVRVRITISGGQVTRATATDYPYTSGTDRRINDYAIPRLQAESVGTTDGKIDFVTGATYTSEGFTGSLQDAIDRARP
jgi:uncharacterized protein with FMN-binding domain